MKCLRKDVQNLAYELWCKLDTVEEQSVLHDDVDVFNKNEMELYDAIEKYLKAEGVFICGSLNEKFNEGV
ncbi:MULTISPECIES: hypothetical protein [Bacillus]|uniref:hypothetical protein n=1 Tax=Bacillus TaxID=1386 RepID=UPI000B43A113|nr:MULTISPECIES: hypothetical protein [Bacillus]MBY7121794.1 hypothetical protein [Bacillus sp. 16GRE42]